MSSKHAGAAEFYSKGIQHVSYQGRYLVDYINNDDMLTVNKAIDGWLWEYLKEDASEERKQELREKVFAGVFYLILKQTGCKNFSAKAGQFDEALQNACIACVEAMDKFDFARGAKFSTYIHRCVLNGSYCRTYKSFCIVTPPSAVRKRTLERLKKEVAGVVSEEEPVNSAVQYDEQEGTCCFLTDNTELENLNMWEGATQTEEDYAEHMFIEEVRDLLLEALETDAAKLTDCEKTTLTHRFGLFGAPSLKNAEVVSLLQDRGVYISKARVTQYYTRALEKLGKFFREQGIDTPSILY